MQDLRALADDIKHWSAQLGFNQAGVAGIDLAEDEAHLRDWLAQGQHGRMEYMARHGDKRSRPAELQPGTLRVISVRMDYGNGDDAGAWATLAHGERAYVARYALGRDYHKLMRNRLQALADRIAAAIGDFGYRAFVDSAPVLERALARNAGLGWIGKNACLINRDAGSWFFLGEIYTDLPLPVDAPASAHCGTCTRCIDVCPTQAIVAPNRVDARRCISYLTIELKGSIPEEFRAPIGNRIFGCDDCQLACPWNKYAQRSPLPDFDGREGFAGSSLLALWDWNEADFLRRTEGSAIRRIGWLRWRRNLAVVSGNALRNGSDAAESSALRAALQSARDAVAVEAGAEVGAEACALLREHLVWALAQHA